ncbi:MAG TPA: DUF4214 domain-containing protein [Iamia sp.]|nr:DUF4214 domain-containing protein [Iamia sp.]
MSAVLMASIGVAATTAAPSGAALPACTKTWTNTAGGSWDLGTNWSGSTIPLPTDHVCITTAGTYTVTLPDGGLEVTVASLTLGASSGATTQTLVVARGSAVDGSGLLASQGIAITSRGALELDESSLTTVSVGVGDAAVIANAGRISQVTGQTDTHEIHGDVVNTGTFRLDQPIFVEGDFTNEGILQDNHVLHIMGTMWTKSGTITGEWVIVAYDGLRIGDAVIGTPLAIPSLVIQGGELSIESTQPVGITVRNEITLVGDTAEDQNLFLQTIEDQNTTLTFSGEWVADGLISLEPGEVASTSIIGAEDGDTLVNGHELARFEEDGAEVTIAADVVNRGLIETGDGDIDVVGDLTNEEAIGLEFGEVTVGGDLVLDPTSLVTHELGVDGPTVVGHLVVTGDASIDGTLLTDTPFDPPAAPVNVITAATRTGTFDELAFTGEASYDPQYTSTQVNLVHRPSESGAHRFVRAAYQDFLDRQPTPTELSQRAAALDGATLTRASLVRQLSLSPEYVTALVQRFYLETLGRPGGAAGVAFWVDQLRTGHKTVAEVAGSFYASAENFERVGGTNAAWIGALYDVFFERPPSAGDQTYWTTRIAQRGRTRVAIELFQSLESRRQRVDRLYLDLLGRHGDPAGVDFWAGRITSQGDLALAVNLASSVEYRDRAEDRYP